MWFMLLLLMARDHLCRAEWISGLPIQRQHREHHVSLDFELSKHESLHSIQLSLVHGCAQCSAWRVSLSSVSTAHMSFNLGDHNCKSDIESPMVQSPENRSSIGNLVICCVTIARSAAMRTDHRIRVCNFVYLFWAHSCLLRAPVPCARVSGRATHGLHTMWALVYRGCLCQDPPLCPPMPKAGWHRGQSANSVLCLCCVVVARAFDNLELWSW